VVFGDIIEIELVARILVPSLSGTNAGGDLELIFEQIGMDLIFFTPPPRDDGTSWALASPERH
jgi:hypothetical protein